MTPIQLLIELAKETGHTDINGGVTSGYDSVTIWGNRCRLHIIVFDTLVARVLEYNYDESDGLREPYTVHDHNLANPDSIPEIQKLMVNACPR